MKDTDKNLSSLISESILKVSEPALPALSIVDQWQHAWPRAIARAWVDPDFENALIADAQTALNKVGFQNIITVGNETFNIWNLLEIKVIKPGGSAHITAGSAKDKTSPDYHLPEPNTGDKAYTTNGWAKAIDGGRLKMYLTLVLPPAPSTDDQAIAIVDYEAAGKIYPITFLP